MATGSRVGDTLRRRREQLGVSLDRAARDTNVRLRTLEIIESGDFANYPPHGHAMGIISSYARYLELDPHPLLEEFDSEYQAYKASAEIAESADRTRRGLGRFGERVSSSKTRPKTRESNNPVDRRRRGDDGRSSSKTVNRSLKEERAAEEDNRYKTGSVRVVGTRQTGTFKSSRNMTRGTSGRLSAARHDDYRTDHAPAGLSGGHYASIRDRQWREEHPDDDFDNTGTGKRSESGRLTSSSSRLRSGASRRSGSLSKTEKSEADVTPSRSSKRAGASRSRAASTARDISSEDKGTSPNFFGIEVESDDSGTKRTRRRHSSRSRQNDSPRNSSEPRADENIFERIARILKSVFSERRTRIIALAFAVIVIGVIVSATVLISTAGNRDSGLIEVQGGAVNDTTTSDDGNAARKTITTANGNPVTIKIEVASGETSLISITYDGGNPYSGTAVGPFTREFPVTESFSATFGNPDAVTVSENGNPIDIAKNNDGTGSLSINVQAAASSSNTQITQ